MASLEQRLVTILDSEIMDTSIVTPSHAEYCGKTHDGVLNIANEDARFNEGKKYIEINDLNAPLDRLDSHAESPRQVPEERCVVEAPVRKPKKLTKGKKMRTANDAAGVKRAKRLARERARKKHNREQAKKRIARTKMRRSKTVFEEPSAYYMDLCNKRATTESGFDEVFDVSFYDVFSDLIPVSLLKTYGKAHVKRIIVACCLFGRDIYRSSSGEDVGVACTHLAVTIMGDKFDDVMSSLAGYVADLSKSFIDVVSTESGKLQSMSSFIHDMLDSHVAHSLKRLLAAMFSLKLVGKDVTFHIRKFFGPMSKMTYVEVFDSVLSAVQLLLDFGYRFMMGEDYCSLWSGSDSAGKLLEELCYLLDRRDKITFGLPTEGLICFNDFCMRAQAAIDSSSFTLSMMPPSDPRKAAIKEKIAVIKLELETKKYEARGRHREEPFGVVIVGYPGIGKSKLVRLVHHIWSTVKGREFEPSHVYTRVQTSDYHDGHVMYSTPIWHYSEVGSESVSQAEMSGGKIHKEFQQVMDSLPFSLNTAFSDKNKTYCVAELVTIDTNNADMHVNKLCYSSGAQKRRWLYIHVDVKPEFRRDGTTCIDPDKSFRSDNHVLDKYNYEFKRYSSYKNGAVIDETRSYRVTNLEDFIRNLAGEFEDHLRHQAKMMQTDMFDIVSEVLNYGDYVADEKELEEKEIDRFEVLDASLCNTESGLLTTVYLSTFAFITLMFGRLIRDIIMVVLIKLLMRVGSISKKNGVMFGMYSFYTGNPYFCVLSILFFISSYFLTKSKFYADCKYRQAKLYFNIIKAYFGGGPVNFYKDHKYEVLSAAVALAISAGSVYYYISKRKRRVDTESSNFYIDDLSSRNLTSMEDKYDTAKAPHRLKTKHDGWTKVELSSNIPVFNGDSDIFDKIVRQNTHLVTVISGGNKRPSHIFGVCSTFAILNRHSFSDEQFDIVVHPSDVVSEDGARIRIDNNSWVSIADDLVLINTRGVIRFRDVRKHITDMKIVTPFDGVFNSMDTYVVYSDKPPVINDVVQGKLEVSEVYCYKSPYVPYLCGNVLTRCDSRGGCHIVGVHFAGSPQQARRYAVPITRDSVCDGVEYLEIQDPCVGIYSQGIITESLSLPIPKSPFMHESFPHLTYFGKVDGNVTVNNKSRMQRVEWSKGFLTNFFKEHFFFQRDEIYGKPLMRPRNINGEYLSPYNIGLRKMNQTPPQLDSCILSKSIDVVKNHILVGLDERKIEPLSPLNVEDAINGSLDDGYLRRINSSTSSGYGFPASKDAYIPIVVDDDFVVREAISDLKDLLVDCFERYEEEKSCNFIFSVQLKDEPRLMEKVLKGKTRLFYMTSLQNLILSRMFLGRFYTLMVEHSDVFCTAVGYNMHIEADAIYRKLYAFGPHVIEFDYSGFDVSNPLGISRAACTVIYDVCEQLGYNEKALVVLRGILSDNLYPLIEMNKDLFVKPGMQPSGKYGTAEDNSLRGLLMLVYAWYSLPWCKDRDFFDYVLPITYGDDVLASVKDEAISHFNNLIYADFCLKNYGMVLTPAKKDAELTASLTLKEATFLKRSFVHDERREVYVSPLDLNSMYKSLEWCIPSRAISMDEQLICTCCSFLWEAYFHVRDPNRFSRMRECLIEELTGVLREASSLEERLPTFFTIESSL